MQELSVTSWNVQGNLNMIGYTPFRKIRSFLHGPSADIFAFQELCNAEKKLKDIPWARDYSVFIPKLNCSKDNDIKGFNHNVILSKYPLLHVEEVDFPGTENGIHLENCIKADIKVGSRVVRLYNCHFGIIHVGIATRLRQLKRILLDARDHRGPIIVCGDMNVTIPASGLNRKIISLWHREPESEMSVEGRYVDYDEREIFSTVINEHGFKDTLDLHTPTWSPFKTKIWELFKLKLDWFLLKNSEAINVNLGKYISDHKSVEVRVGF